jgi:L-alanine-DL-glutamate epimerase-like enolase superfamily enzyme
MKVGTSPADDPVRVKAARDAIGSWADLFVDANGAYTRKQALEKAQAFADEGVAWFEEPVVHSDLEGLRLLRDRSPAGMKIATGEYGYDLRYFREVFLAGAADIVQADITRCGGVTEFMRVAALCAAWELPLSAHCAPSLHTHPCCAALPMDNVEYFHDHARIEQMLFEGAVKVRDGRLWPDLSRPGNGLELKRADAAKYAAG